jgi:cytosine/adenosine deaminase-related metal-dependent hydrolase
LLVVVAAKTGSSFHRSPKTTTVLTLYSYLQVWKQDNMDPAVKIPPVPQGRLILTRIGTLATGDDTLGDIDDAAVVIRNNVIEWVGKTTDLPSDLVTAATAERGIRDCSHILIMTPGFVNTHHHFYQTLTRGVAPANELFGWLTTLYDVWKFITPSMLKAACTATACELLLSGCTLATDHAYIWPNGCRLDDEIAAVLQTGLRFQPVRGSMSLGKSQGGLPPDEVVEKEQDILLESRRLIETYHDPNKYAMLRIALGPCSPFSVTKEIMIQSAQLAREYDKVLLHTHLAENTNDIDFSLEKYGERPKDFIASVQWDQHDCWFAHCVQLNQADMEVFGSKQCGVAHCPSSNLRLASGIAPVRQMMEDYNIPVGIGCDGSASNDHSNLLSEGRLAMLIARVRDFRSATNEQGTNAVPGDPTALSPKQALYMATVGGARCLNREDEIGKIVPGYAADLVGWSNHGDSLTALSLIGCAQDPLSGLFVTSPPSVTISIVNGDPVVWDGKLLKVDLATVIANAKQASKDLMTAAGYNQRAKE